jgi:hypothetical protein
MDSPNALMRETPRPRHLVGKRTIRLVRPFFRYSRVRDAYVLRVIGRRHGPVLRLKRPGLRPRPPRVTDGKPAGRVVRERQPTP